MTKRTTATDASSSCPRVPAAGADRCEATQGTCARSRRGLLGLAGVSALLALMLIAGCGGDDDEPGDSAPAAEQPAPGPAEGEDDDEPGPAGGEDDDDRAAGDRGGGAGAAPDPCELLGGQQVSSRLPGPASPEPDLGWSSGQCRWEVDSEEEPRIIVGIAPWPEFGELIEGLNVSPEPLAGLADEAVLLDGTVAPGTFSADGRTLHLRRGERGIGIVWDRTPDPPPSEEEMRELAEEVLGAL